MSVRGARPFGDKDPPAALFYASRDSTREYPKRHLAGYAGILKADAFDPQARLAEVRVRIADHPVYRLDELPLWNWAVEGRRRNLAA